MERSTPSGMPCAPERAIVQSRMSAARCITFRQKVFRLLQLCSGSNVNVTGNHTSLLSTLRTTTSPIANEIFGARILRGVPASARVGRAGERVLAITSFSLKAEPPPGFNNTFLSEGSNLDKDCFGATPKPTRETRALPNPKNFASGEEYFVCGRRFRRGAMHRQAGGSGTKSKGGNVTAAQVVSGVGLG